MISICPGLIELLIPSCFRKRNLQILHPSNSRKLDISKVTVWDATWYDNAIFQHPAPEIFSGRMCDCLAKAESAALIADFYHRDTPMPT